MGNLRMMIFFSIFLFLFIPKIYGQCTDFMVNNQIIHTTCGLDNGAINLTITGGTSPYSYVWTGGLMGSNPTNVASGTYTVTVSDNANPSCTAVKTLAVEASIAVGINETITDTRCGLNNGAINLNITGGTSPYSYLWTGGLTGSNPTNVASGTYTVTVSDNANPSCTAVKTLAVGASTAVGINETITNTRCGLNNGAINLTITGGTSPYSYVWTGGLMGSNPTNVASGTYTVTVSDNANPSCTAVKTLAVEASTAVGINETITDTRCGLNNGAINLTITGGTSPYSYVWTGGLMGSNPTNVASGTYTVTVSDNANPSCTAVKTLAVGASTAVGINETITDTRCGLNNGAINLTITGGTSPYSYVWTGGLMGSNPTNVASGTYTVTVSDNANPSCTAVKTLAVGASTAVGINETITNTRCGLNNGAIALTVSGGTSPYSYVWTGGLTGSNPTNVASGTYTVTVSDNANPSCTAVKTLAVGASTAVGINETITNTRCGLNNGAINLTITGGTSPYSYVWTGGLTGSNPTNVASGTYTVTVSDNANPSCTAVKTLAVGASTAVGINETITNTRCGLNNGAIALTVSGGTSPYSYVWTGGLTGSNPTNVASGTYTVTVSDNANPSCTAVKTLAVGASTAVGINETITNTRCGLNNGAINLTITGGTSPYSYVWTGGLTGSNPTNVASGTYTVTVSDNANPSCTAVKTLTVGASTAATASIAGLDFICERASELLTASGGVQYIWSDGTNDSSIKLAGLSDGNYTFTVTVTDTNGCTDTESKDVVVKNVPAIDCDITSGQNQGERNFQIKFIDEMISFDSINFTLTELGTSKTILESRKDANKFTLQFDIGQRIKLSVIIYYKNGCSFSIKEKEFFINDQKCQDFVPDLFLENTKFSENLSSGVINYEVCNSKATHVRLKFSKNAGNKLLFISYKNKRYDLLTGDTIAILDTFYTDQFKKHEFDLKFDITSGTAFEQIKTPCGYSLYIDNQPLPTLTLTDSIFCFYNKKDLDIIPKFNVVNTTFKYLGIPNKISFSPGSPNYLNDNKSYDIKLTDIKASNNVCKEYDKTFTYRIYRTPEIKIIQDLCKDDSTRQILDIDPKDNATQWTILRNGNKIGLSTSGKIFNTNGEITVFGALVHSGGPTCYTDTVKQKIIVKPLPSAKISSYTKDCGPFYKVDSLGIITNKDATYNWKLSNGEILDIYKEQQIIGVAGNGNLTLTLLSKDGCYDHDTISIANSTNFSYSNDTIQFRTCNTDTLFFLQNFKDGECYRWMYINNDGDIKEISEIKKPYINLKTGQKPILVKFLCNTPCSGEIVSNRSQTPDHDCNEDMAENLKELPLQIRPNPAFDFVELYSDFKYKGNYDITIYDISGRQTASFEIRHDGGIFKFPMDVSQWQSGMYFVNVGSETKKIIVIK